MRRVAARVPSLDEVLAGRRRRVARARQVFQTKWFSIEQLPYKPRQPFYRLSCPDSVVMVAMTDDAKLVMVRQYRPALGLAMTEWPAGEVGPGESIEGAVVREFDEETGYQCRSVTYLGSRPSEPSRTTHMAHCFFGASARRRARRKPEAGIEIALVRPDQFGRLAVRLGPHMASPTLGLYYLAHLRGFV